MSRPRNRRNENENQNDGWSGGDVAAAAGLATVAGGALYWLFSGSKKPEAPQTVKPQNKPPPSRPATSEGGSGVSGLINLLSGLASPSRYYLSQ